MVPRPRAARTDSRPRDGGSVRPRSSPSPTPATDGRWDRSLDDGRSNRASWSAGPPDRLPTIGVATATPDRRLAGLTHRRRQPGRRFRPDPLAVSPAARRLPGVRRPPGTGCFGRFRLSPLSVGPPVSAGSGRRFRRFRRLRSPGSARPTRPVRPVRQRPSRALPPVPFIPRVTARPARPGAVFTARAGSWIGRSATVPPPAFPSHGCRGDGITGTTARRPAASRGRVSRTVSRGVRTSPVVRYVAGLVGVT